jgi:hypothetical protein
MNKFAAIILTVALMFTAVYTAGCRERSVALPGLEPTATNTPAFGYVFDFEGSVGQWALGGDPAFTAVSAVSAASVPGGTVPHGSGCAQVTCQYTSSNTGGEIVHHPGNPDYTQASSISARVYVPSDLPSGYSLQVFIMTMPGYAFTGNNVSALTLGAWNTITLTLTGVLQLNNVDTVAVQMLKNGGADWTGNIYVDYIVIQ